MFLDRNFRHRFWFISMVLCTSNAPKMVLKFSKNRKFKRLSERGDHDFVFNIQVDDVIHQSALRMNLV